LEDDELLFAQALGLLSLLPHPHVNQHLLSLRPHPHANPQLTQVVIGIGEGFVFRLERVGRSEAYAYVATH
jgi:hypothetical protein